MSDPELIYILIIESMPNGIDVVFYINQNKFIRNKQKMFMNFLDVKRNVLRNVEVTEDTVDLNTGKVEISVTINPIEVNSISLHIDSGYGKLYKINEFYISNTRPRYTDIFNVKRVSHDPIDCEIMYSTSQCVPVCTPANQTNGTRFKYRVENIKTFPENGGLSCPLDINNYPNTSETIVEECEQKICNDCYGYWSEYSECDANGLRYRRYTVVNPGDFGGQPCDTVNGDVEEGSCESPLISDTNFDVIQKPVRIGNVFKVGNYYYGIVYPGRFKFNTTLFGTQNNDGTVDPSKPCIVTARDEYDNVGAITFTPRAEGGFDMSRTEDEIITDNNITVSEASALVKPLSIEIPRIIIYRSNYTIYDTIEASFDWSDLKSFNPGWYRFIAVQTHGFDVKESGNSEYVRKTDYTVMLTTTQQRNDNCLSWGVQYASAPFATDNDRRIAGNVPNSQKSTFGISSTNNLNTTCSLYNTIHNSEDWNTRIKWNKN